ncbi:timeless protein [Culex quinquefasciatus]|uniref:Timeless n=1 Tax=Culex quinquefasciatus TaxID=7176 RepID=B0WIS7_CULQU|nr:timeless [Culex quinquefasciatus]EDS28654.1 timeless protein [Culex quinquefasciatus]|eukprot:XP_001848611.1 timeless protein [Culex quinquefasciatus]
MEWLLANPQINSTFGSLGAVVDEVYLVSEDCLVNLEEIIGKLAVEDTTLRTFRRAIGFGQNVKNDIVPLLVHAKDSKILDPTIRLLVNLTVPAECLLPVDLVSKSEIGRHTIFELNKLLITSKEAFVDWKTTKAVIDYMKSILEKDSKLSIQNCDSINNCLLLLRNILHVPEVNTPGETKPAHSTSLQNQILWNLFTQSVDKLLIYLMSCPQRAFWAVTMAQLVALMYKDQHISTLQKLLSFWFESTLSESSEDNESNTSPPQQCSGDSSPMLTSDPTSDSSDNGDSLTLGWDHQCTQTTLPIPGSSKMNTSISKDPSEAEQVSRMGTEFPTQIIVARAIKSHQIYHQTMGTTCAAKHPTQPAHPHDPKAPLVTTNSPPGVENSTVVTAIREFLQALETYKKSSHLTKEDRELLKTLQLQIGSTDDLKCLFVLLLRCYNPSLQSKQYLQDLIVTNHSLLLLLDGIRDIPGANVTDMLSHIRQFATVEIMHQYGLMLEDFRENGAFVNDCIFTMMHHVGGDLGLMNVLFQPNILKTFSLIWETEYEICDDWSDLIEYVIHKFINTPQPSPLTLTSTLPDLSSQLLSSNLMSTWTQEDKDSLQWYYVQCKQSKCMVADILRLFEENGNQQKTRVSIIEQLWEQDIVTLSQYDELMKLENPDYERNVQTPGFSVASAKSEKMDDDNRPSSKAVDDIQVLRDRLFKENKGKLVVWLQKSLLDCCFVKLNLLSGTVVVMEPVPYHCILQKKSIPIVPWNLEQFNVLSYQPFVLLLHKLGFHLPADARKMFVRIPAFWTADILYNIALKLGPLEKSIIKFDLKHLNKALSMEKQTKSEPFPVSDGVIKPDIYGTLARSNKSNPVRSGYTPDVTTNWLQVVMRNKAAAESASSTRAMEIPVTPQVIVSTGAALHPSNGNTGGGKPASHPKLAHDLSIIVEAASNDELPVGEEDDDDELDRSDGPALAGHDVVSDCETASVASDLTRMYVSDEEDKHDIVPQIL